MTLLTTIQANILRSTLFRGRTNREELAHDTGLSPASITNHTRPLLDAGLLLAEPRRKESVKRPVDELTLNPGFGTHLAIRLAGRVMVAELLNFDGSLVEAMEHELPELSQQAFFLALALLFDRSVVLAERQDRRILCAGIAIDGLVAPRPGVIFGIRGFSNWEACDLSGILPQLNVLPSLRVWTRILCKTRGFAGEKACNHAIGYVEFSDDCFRIGTLQRDRPDLGWHGTASNFLHRAILPDGPLCYCGRRGCLAQALHNGPIPPELLACALCETLQESHVTFAGIEWHDSRHRLTSLPERDDLHFFAVEDGELYYRRGLRELVVGDAINRMIREAR